MKEKWISMYIELLKNLSDEELEILFQAIKEIRNPDSLKELRVL
ncbi:hypothetical protein [Tissierella praeacuta]